MIFVRSKGYTYVMSVAYTQAYTVYIYTSVTYFAISGADVQLCVNYKFHLHLVYILHILERN